MKNLFELERRLARFEIDDKANTNASRRLELRLSQLLRLAFAIND
jgi:predicted component of type VI protein secretion system